MSYSETGTGGALSQQSSFEFTPFTLTETEEVVGNHSAIYALVDSYRTNGWSGSVTPEGQSPKSRLVARRIIDDDTEASWSLDVQWSMVEPKESQKFWAYLDTLASDSARATALAAITAAVTEMATGVTTKYDALADSTQKSWALEIFAGRAIYEPSGVLRRSYTYAGNYSVATDWTDAGKVWSVSHFTGTDAPSAIIGTLPSGSQWLMTPAGIEKDSEGRITVSTHWVQGRYPTYAYTHKT